jgi:hypothetical protein
MRNAMVNYDVITLNAFCIKIHLKILCEIQIVQIQIIWKPSRRIGRNGLT